MLDVYVCTYNSVGCCCPFCVICIPIVHPFCPSLFHPPRAISHWIRKKKSGPAGVEMPGILLLFLFFFWICTCAHSHNNTHVYTSTHTHIAITLDRSYSMGILLLLLWPAEFFLIFSLIPSNCLCVCTHYQSGFCPFCCFYSIFRIIISWTENSASQTRPKQVARLPSVHSDVCVGAVGIRPHFCPPHYIPFLGGFGPESK